MGKRFTCFLMVLALLGMSVAPPLSWGVSYIGTLGSGSGQFSEPMGIAMNKNSGRIYVTDKLNSRVQILDSKGAFISSFGTYGNGNGQFGMVHGISVAPDGKVFVSDNYGNGAYNGRVQIFDENGVFIRCIGGLTSASGIALDALGNLYVAEPWNQRIAVVNTSGVIERTIGVAGTGPGQVSSPYGVGVDSQLNVYVTEVGSHRIQKFDASGHSVWVVGKVDGGGNPVPGNGPGEFGSPVDVKVDGNDNLYVLDAQEGTVQKLRSDGTFIEKRCATAGLNWPQGIALVGKDTLFVADTYNNRIMLDTVKVESIGVLGENGNAITTSGGAIQMTASVSPSYAENQTVIWSVQSGTGEAAIDNAGKLSAIKDGTVLVKAMAKDGGGAEGAQVVTISNQAGPVNGSNYLGESGSGDGQFKRPMGILTSRLDGRIYVVDSLNYRVQVFDSKGHYLSSFGSYGNGPGQFGLVVGIQQDAAGNLYISDMFGNGAYNGRVQIFDSNGGFIKTVNGLTSCKGIALGHDGNLYVTEPWNQRVAVVDPSGAMIRTIGTSGTGPGQLSSPYGVAVDRQNNLYVAELGNHRVQKLDASGNFLWALGKTDGAGQPISGNGPGEFGAPVDVKVDDEDHLYVLDSQYGTVQKFTSDGVLMEVPCSSGIFNWPQGFDVLGKGVLFVSDTYNDRIKLGVAPVESIFVSGAGGSAITTSGGALQMQATVLPAYATEKAVIWSLDNPAGQAEISPSGVLKAYKNGLVTVRATAQDGSGKTGTCAVVLSNQGDDLVPPPKPPEPPEPPKPPEPPAPQPPTPQPPAPEPPIQVPGYGRDRDSGHESIIGTNTAPIEMARPEQLSEIKIEILPQAGVPGKPVRRIGQKNLENQSELYQIKRVALKNRAKGLEDIDYGGFSISFGAAESPSAAEVISMDNVFLVTLDLGQKRFREDKGILAAVRYEKDDLEHPALLGGFYNEEKGTFSFYTEKLGTFSLARSDHSTSMLIGLDSKAYAISSGEKGSIAAMKIQNGRTFVSPSLISDVLGIEIPSNAKQEPLLPLRAVCEKSGYKILWIPPTREIVVIGQQNSSRP